MFNSKQLQTLFNCGLAFDDYVKDDDNGKRWQQVRSGICLSQQQKELLNSFSREMKVLVMSGIWCGDCIEQCPIMDVIACGSDKIELKFIDRDESAELKDLLRINAGNRVPVAIFMAEDFEFCSLYGDRTLSRYRKVAHTLNGACSTGIGMPNDEQNALAVAEWLNEFERIQLMLQTSARLRKLHGEI